MAAMPGTFLRAAALLLYLALVLAINFNFNWPIRAQRPACSGACALSFSLALLSTFFLPWMGVPMAYWLGLPAEISCLWFPFIILAVLFAGKAGEHIAAKGAWLLCVVISISSLAWFAYENGVPGFPLSVEALGTLNRLEGLRNGRLCAAMVLFALSLVPSFCEISGIASHRTVSFSYAAGLCLVFLPVDTGRLFSLPPTASIPVDFLVTLIAAVVIQNVLFKRVQNFLSRSRAHRTRLLTPVLFALAGAYFLLTSTGG